MQDVWRNALNLNGIRRRASPSPHVLRSDCSLTAARVHGGGPPLTGEDSARPLHLDAHPRTFGSFQVRASFGDGRFGPVFLADDPETGQHVVVRTFTQPLTDEQRDALLTALCDLRELPLDHPSVARPIDCGLDGETPYFVHAFLEGIPADEYLAANGRRRLADLIPLLTPAAAAIDFSSAAGVTHGALGLRDLIIGTNAAGVSGFGLVQALQTAGIDPGGIAADPADGPSTATDIRALATITATLLIPEDASQIRHLVDHPTHTALEFVAALQDVLAQASAVEAFPSESAAFAISEAGVTAPELTLRDAPDLAPPDLAAPSLFAASSHVASESDRRSRRTWVPLAVAASLAVGLIAGFAGGVVVGRRDARTVPPGTTAPPPRPTATAGQIFTDQGVVGNASPEVESRGVRPAVPGSAFPVPGSPVQGSDVRRSGVPGSQVPGSGTRPEPATPGPQTRSNVEPRTRNPEPRTPNREPRNREPGTRNPELPPSLWVESRPMGANVYVDGQLVGRTPLLLGGIDPGGHTVRLEMTGYQQWMTRVIVAENGRTRVAASLEP